MRSLKMWFQNIPGWLIPLVVFGLLYLTGLHTEAIGQVQRALLATGIIQPDLPEIPAEPKTEIAVAENYPEALLANDFLLQDLDGNIVKFSSLKNRAVFLNIWATWCPPCVAEMPGIQALYNKVGANPKIAFVMLSADQDGVAKVQRFVQKKGYTFPVYMPAGPLPQAFQTRSIPSTFILDRKGNVVASHQGMADYDTQAMLDFLLKLAK